MPQEHVKTLFSTEFLLIKLLDLQLVHFKCWSVKLKTTLVHFYYKKHLKIVIYEQNSIFVSLFRRNAKYCVA